jgi:hypothetical protein
VTHRQVERGELVLHPFPVVRRPTSVERRLVELVVGEIEERALIPVGAVQNGNGEVEVGVLGWEGDGRERMLTQLHPINHGRPRDENLVKVTTLHRHVLLGGDELGGGPALQTADDLSLFSGRRLTCNAPPPRPSSCSAPRPSQRLFLGIFEGSASPLPRSVQPACLASRRKLSSALAMVWLTAGAIDDDSRIARANRPRLWGITRWLEIEPPPWITRRRVVRATAVVGRRTKEQQQTQVGSGRGGSKRPHGRFAEDGDERFVTAEGLDVVLRSSTWAKLALQPQA